MKENKKLPNDIMSLMSNPPHTLDDVFNNFDELAEERFVDIYSLRPYAELLANHSKKILDEKHTIKTIDKAFEKLQEDILNHNSNLDYYGKMCLTFRTMSEQLNRDSNQPAAIWGLIMSAYFLGATSIASDIITNKHIDTLEKNEAAAKAKNSAYAESRSYFIQSIHEKSPPNGWKTRSHLASELSEHIAHYERTTHNLKTAQDITARLLRWAREYPDVALAVSQHVRRKRKSIDSH
ncbi:TPA: hypothetical protein NII25_005807 [Pseudomonas aeruginosa]|nr:hypothetical protein [Pseudomonas aeruginosa]